MKSVQIFRHVGRRVIAGRRIACAVAAQIVGSDSKVLCQHVHQAAEQPYRQVTGYGVDQDDVRTTSTLLIVEAHPIEINHRHCESPPIYAVI
jgi:hypothetical protein